ncbi:hypothetical protein SAMN05443244_2350 [Terriglobus roseus]|uniref:Uncharacterized protein n=1 Tax=Terriglobus roseus TaxID=392734 RepID=A0A1H4NTF6_9BACT|nr:hypothetical protein SAMN05443244_2350 [Terriglobus roseus]
MIGEVCAASSPFSPAEPDALKSYDPPRNISSGELVKIRKLVGRMDLADRFLMNLISGKNAEAELSDHEAAHLFDSLQRAARFFAPDSVLHWRDGILLCSVHRIRRRTELGHVLRGRSTQRRPANGSAPPDSYRDRSNRQNAADDGSTRARDDRGNQSPKGLVSTVHRHRRRRCNKVRRRL